MDGEEEGDEGTGALATMEAVYRSTTFRDDLPTMQLEYAAASHKVLSALLSSQRGTGASWTTPQKVNLH
eukprot:jgi/Pico_ML_1/55605/g1271.t1